MDNVTPDDGERSPDVIGGTRFAIVPEWILDEPGDVVKLYGILDRYAGRDRLVWPGQAELAERMGCSERQVRRHLTRLRHIGALEMVKRRYNGTTLYVLRKDEPGLSSPERPDQPVLTDRTQPSALSGHGSPPNESHLTRAKEPSRKVAAAPFPEKFLRTTAMIEWAMKNAPGVDLDYETHQFADYWRGRQDVKRTDWSASWRTWIRKAHRDLQAKAAKQRPPSGEGQFQTMVDQWQTA
jgi:hypothetical protein